VSDWRCCCCCVVFCICDFFTRLVGVPLCVVVSFQSYSAHAGSLDADRLPALMKSLVDLEAEGDSASVDRRIQGYRAFLTHALELCRDKWVNFDLGRMVLGIVLLLGVAVVQVLYVWRAVVVSGSTIAAKEHANSFVWWRGTS
jgi:hypothetical protein